MKSVDPSQLPLRDGAAIHVIGAGGAGMNAIGAVLISMGYSVSGSDLRDSAGVHRLRSLGARIEIGHNSANLGDCEAICR
ncbi:MAG: Mur ligase domain-containing protein, partial [Actinomycetota bacterium]|nr:Mur ligase domain-containing protein [Actinomycetota bacterium]